MEAIVVIVVATLTGIVFAVVNYRQRSLNARYDQLLSPSDEVPAFEGGAHYDSLSPARITQIRTQVDRVGVVSISEQDPNRQGKNAPWLQFEVYLLDTNGVFHEVKKLHDEEPAAAMALELAEKFECALDDPDGITLGR